MLKPEEVKSFKHLGVFKVKAVGDNFIVVSHGSKFFRLKGAIQGLQCGEALWIQNNLLVPKHQPLFG
jgi:hypothetical protein